MSKNVVVCCDGTGNKFGLNNSNVIKLYTCLSEGAGQKTYYHPGLGTMGDPNRSTWVGKKMTRLAGLAFGWGFRANLADAYEFLMDAYAPGDRIYLFGFSRGAYTVRALAGAISLCGLLCPGNEGHLPYLLEIFSNESRRAYKEEGRHQLKPSDESVGFRETFSRVVPIHFVGVWDTVSSVGWIYDPVKLMFDGQNPIVRKGRHAISVDERRCFFQANLWGAPLPPDDTPLLRDSYTNQEDRTQDIVQAWFAGVHSDVGGSYEQKESAPAMDALAWILREAVNDGDGTEFDKDGLKINRGEGLDINQEKYDAIFGRGSEKYPILSTLSKNPEPMTKIHESLKPNWWPLELFPHKYFDAAGKKSWRFLPWPHSRELPKDSLIHPSLRRWLSWKPETKDQKKYNPKNLSADDVVDYKAAPVKLRHPKVMAQLAEENFGVYRSSKVVAHAVRTPLQAAAALLFGLALTLFKLRR